MFLTRGCRKFIVLLHKNYPDKLCIWPLDLVKVGRLVHTEDFVFIFIMKALRFNQFERFYNRNLSYACFEKDLWIGQNKELFHDFLLSIIIIIFCEFCFGPINRLINEIFF